MLVRSYPGPTGLNAGFFRSPERCLLWASAGSGVFRAGPVAYWLFVDDKMNARVTAGSLFWGIVAFWCAYSMAAQVPLRDRRVYWPSALIFFVESVGRLVRAVSALSNQPDSFGFMRGRMETIGLFTLNLSTIGGVTNPPNRRMCEERLEQAERRALEDGRHLALIYCDVDGFKSINDRLGHEGGDKGRGRRYRIPWAYGPAANQLRSCPLPGPRKQRFGSDSRCRRGDVHDEAAWPFRARHRYRSRPVRPGPFDIVKSIQ